MSVTTTPRRRWTDASIESELRAQIAELGQFPTRADLVSQGLRGLWDAMRSSGGVDSWRDRLTCARTASHEQIAARAYELYEDGQPGDQMDHWLAAERELVSEAA